MPSQLRVNPSVNNFSSGSLTHIMSVSRDASFEVTGISNKH